MDGWHTIVSSWETLFWFHHVSFREVSTPRPEEVASKAVQRAEAALESKLGDGEYGDMF